MNTPVFRLRTLFVVASLILLVGTACGPVFTVMQPTLTPVSAAPGVAETVLAATPVSAIPVTPVSVAIAPPAAPLAASDFSSAS
jgi:hypothetical protein